MVTSSLCFVTVGVFVRLMDGSLPPTQSAFIRYAIGLIFFLPILMNIARTPGRIKHGRIIWFRGFFHVIAVILWFYAMANITITEVTAIGYTSPLFVTIGAALFLSERIRARRLIALLVGIFGALVILRPGFQQLDLGHFAQLCAAPLFAVSTLIGKKSTEGNSSKDIVAMLTLTCTIFLLPPALLDWVTPTWTDMMWLSLTAVVATCGHFAMTAAFRAAPVTVTQPANVMQLVWATIAGVIIWSDAIDPFVLIGGAIVVASVSYITYREHQLAKARKLA